MSAPPRVRRALGFTFFLYLLQASFATLWVTPFAGLLGRASTLLQDPLALASGADGLLRSAGAFPAFGIAGALWCGVAVLSAPWLQVAWLSSLSQTAGVLRHLSAAGALYLRACVVSLLVLTLACLPLGAWGGVGWGLDSWLASAPDPRLRDVALLVVAVFALITLWLAWLLHDLARARCLEHGALRAVRLALRDLRPPVVAAATGWSLLGLGTAAVQGLTAAHVEQLGTLGAVALVQVACFARLLLRSRWLATAVTCAIAQSQPRQTPRLQTKAKS